VSLVPEWMTRSVGGVKRQYRILTEEEAKLEKIRYVPMRQVTEVGQWGLDDFGFVSEALKVAVMRGKRRGEPSFAWYLIEFPWGQSNSAQRPRLQKGFVKGVRPWLERELRKSRTKELVRLYAAMKAQGAVFDDAAFDILGAVYAPTDEVPRLSAKRMLKEKRVRQMITAELEKLLGSEGITKKAVIEKYEEVRTQAVLLGQLSVAKGVVDKYAEMLDMKPDKVAPAGPLLDEVSFDHLLGANEDDTGLVDEDNVDNNVVYLLRS
jgi:hypothetical protein